VATTQPRGPALVLGAGGWLGAALLTRVLGAGHCRVGAWVDGDAQWRGSTHRGLVAVPAVTWEAPNEAAQQTWAGATAYVVLERAGLNGTRDAVFPSPSAEGLPALGAALLRLGATRLVVVVPHGSNALPAALAHGFADLQEQALGALPLEQLLLVRASQTAADDAGAGWLHRLAALWWAQLRWMIPSNEQPLRSVALAEVVVNATALLNEVQARGVRVLPQGLASRAAHAQSGWRNVLQAWAQGGSG
jgi:hypothetical protein